MKDTSQTTSTTLGAAVHSLGFNRPTSFAQRAAFATTIGIEHFVTDFAPDGPCTLFLRKPVAGKLAVVICNVFPIPVPTFSKSRWGVKITRTQVN
jgi:hypothetical protein